MLMNFLFIFLPLIAGYSISLNTFNKATSLLKLINTSLNYLVFVILFCMGLNLAFLDNLSANLQKVLFYSGFFFVAITIANTFILMTFTHFYKKTVSKGQTHIPVKKQGNRNKNIDWSMLKGALELLGCVAFGLFIGILSNDTLFEAMMHYALNISQYALFVLIFLVGILLRQSRLSLKKIILNKVGLILSSLVLISSLAAGSLSGWLLGLDLNISLSLSSGFGWYSLSGILISESYGPLFGSIAFFNDLAREILVIILIPLLGRSYPFISLGLSGATSMDFTLPILQKHAGIEIVPAAIVQGFILSLAGIILMTLIS